MIALVNFKILDNILDKIYQMMRQFIPTCPNTETSKYDEVCNTSAALFNMPVMDQN
jgi:hypothetical protein